MPFAPHEIEHKKFVTAMRGYQTDEVDAFLRAVAADYQAALSSRGSVPAPRELLANFERVVQASRASVEAEAAELHRAAEAEAAAIKAATQREIAEMRALAKRETEEQYAALARQSDHLLRVEEKLRNELQVLEQLMGQAKDALAQQPEVAPLTEPVAPAQPSVAADNGRGDRVAVAPTPPQDA
jgi:DivIVA domain-containing protein